MSDRALLSEFAGDLDYSIQEQKSGRRRRYVIEGIFIQAEIENHNKRIYPKEVMDKAIERYNREQITSSRAVGELNHPDSIFVNLDKVSHRILSLEWDGNDVYGSAVVLDTPCGEIVKQLIDGGVQLGVSSRGVGSLRQMTGGIQRVEDDFELRAIDVVQNPSAPDSYVTAIMESADNGGIDMSRIYETGLSEQAYVTDRIREEMRIRDFAEMLRDCAI